MSSLLSNRPLKTKLKFVSAPLYRHSGFRGLHPLAISRLDAVEKTCRALGWLNKGNYHESQPATVATLTRFHDPDYVSAIRQAVAAGEVSKKQREKYNFGTMENPLFPSLFERASNTVGGSICAAQLALAGHTVFHPAGGTHHGRRDRASGFCYFNDPVFALQTLREGDHNNPGLPRIAYLDLDAHHGDGVEDAFANQADVLTFSIHEENRWPYSGTNIYDSTHHIYNAPVPSGLNDNEFQALLEEAMLPLLAHFQPAAIVITCGADALHGDPLSRMELSNNALWHAVLALIAQTPAAVVLGGGGYNPWTTVRCWAGLWGQLLGAEMPARLPDQIQAMLSAFDSDLVDEEDQDPAWLATLSDPPRQGPIRPEVAQLIRALQPPL